VAKTFYRQSLILLEPLPPQEVEGQQVAEIVLTERSLIKAEPVAVGIQIENQFGHPVLVEGTDLIEN
jgi:hypothetical protein